MKFLRQYINILPLKGVYDTCNVHSTRVKKLNSIKVFEKIFLLHVFKRILRSYCPVFPHRVSGSPSINRYDFNHKFFMYHSFHYYSYMPP